jgi:predicted PurR-regulated permease PerM
MESDSFAIIVYFINKPLLNWLQFKNKNFAKNVSLVLFALMFACGFAGAVNFAVKQPFM